MSLAARKLLWTVVQDDPVAFSGVCNSVCAAGGEVREWVRPWSFWTRRPIHPSLPWVYARGHGSSMCATSTATTTQLKLCHYTCSFKESEKREPDLLYLIHSERPCLQFPVTDFGHFYEMSHQASDELPWYLGQISMVPRRWIVFTLAIRWLFI